MPSPAMRWRRLRFIPLGIGAASLATGFWTGLARLGLEMPGGTPSLAEFHSALMIAGFLGTLISLERAVAVGLWWAYLAPALSALGAIALIAGAPGFGASAFLLAGLTLTVVSILVVTRQPALFTVVLAIGAACWSVGTALWLMGAAMPDVAAWWLGFLVLTIAAERLELSRLLAPPLLSQAAFAVAASLLIVGALRGEYSGEAAPFSGISLIALTVWLLRYDVALKTVRRPGPARFSAACMLGGYAWLAVAGVLLLLAPPATAAFSYDAAVHAITIGFVFSMIFGHAPIILPAVTGIQVRANAAAYVPLALLHGSVLLRVAADLFGWITLRSSSGLLTILALLSYAAVLILASRRK
ncbi:MAG: hypothetical protein IT539_14520 [Bradyrhizobiaceae bacterium]|nr:hypothetical protein [Bradyrhizobiaceae bacterium]